MVLNKSQAEAIYSAMCELNNVGHAARITPVFDGQAIQIDQPDPYGPVVLTWWAGDMHSEHHANQAAFAAAYGLNSDAAPDAPGAIVNPLDNTSLRNERVNSAAGRAIAERLNP